jgi:hypothetical protein
LKRVYLGQEKEGNDHLQDERGSKYFVSRRQSVPVPQSVFTPVQQNIVGFVPVYYMPQYSNTYQPVYTSYYEPDVFGNAVTQPYLGGGQSVLYSGYQMQSPFLFSKR